MERATPDHGACPARILLDASRQEHFLQLAGSMAQIGWWELDPLMDRVHWSAEARAMHESADDAELNLEAALAFYPLPDKQRLHDLLERAIRDNEPFDTVLAMVTGRGAERWVRIVGEPERADGRCARVFGAIQDVTRRHDSDEALRGALQRAEETSRSKTEFLANISHEIRTPMTAIMGFAELLNDPSLCEGDRREFVATILRNSEHLLAIINDVLDLSKMETGELAVHLERICPRALLDDVARTLQERARAKGIWLRTHCEGVVPVTIETDPLRLRQVLTHLVANAVKFTTKGGVDVRLRGDLETVTFAVQDTGIGMTAEQMGGIFRPFTQADSTMSRRHGGAGLGLAICSRLVRLLGGKIDARSTHAVGSIFTICLPVTRAAARPAGGGSSEKSGQGGDVSLRGVRVLLVEDARDDQHLISLLLRKASAEVDVASQGLEALAMITPASEPYDIVLMDMQMPVLDGYATTSELRRRGVRAPIVALTAHALDEDLQRCLDVGCDAYASKPIDRAALLRLVATYARRRETRAA